MSFLRLFIFLTLSIGMFFNAFALESTDVLDTNILKVYNKNILVLDRGVEDGVFKKDHIQITSKDGFIARGICLKASMLSSHWKIYRVVRPELMTKDATYQMRSINQSSIPKDLTKFTKVDFSKRFEDYGDNKEEKQLALQKERVLKYDLPTKVVATETFKENQKSSLSQFVEKNFTNEDIRLDLSRVFLDVFASPISIQTRQDQKETHYGFKINNYGDKYRYEIGLVHRELKVADPVTDVSYESSSSEYTLGFQINRITENVSLVSSAKYFDQKIGDIYYPKAGLQIAPVGLRLHLWEEDPKHSFMDLTYAPAFHSLKYSDPIDLELEELNGLRHNIQARLFSKFTKNVYNETIFTYAPMTSSNQDDLKSSKLLYVNASTSFSYDMGESFSIEYLLEYEADKFRNHIYGVSPDNTIQTFRLHKAFEL